MLTSELIIEEARRLGFALAGVSGDLATRASELYGWWLGQGYAANMHYLQFQKHRRASLTNILPGAKSVVVCALAFPGPEDAGESAADEAVMTNAHPSANTGHEPPYHGKVARYAQGRDYHDVLKEKLTALAAYIDATGEIAPESRSLAYVDTGALPERAYAAQAGIGWIGKNAMLIHPDQGSWFWLGEVITTAALAPGMPQVDRCGSCRRCLDACPTGAILEGVRAIDSRKCISYLTIEHRGPLPKEHKSAIGDWLVGCDICQEVCPWNQRSLRAGRAGIGEPPLEFLNLNEISEMDKAAFKHRFAERSISRAKLEGLQRNAAIVAENISLSSQDAAITEQKN